MKFRIKSFREGNQADIHSKPILDLAMLVAKDYERRSLGLRPDEWHWADTALFRYGYVVDDV